MTTIPEPSPVDHEAAATELMAEIRALVQARIPGFALAAKGRRLKINTTASLTDAFLESTASACAANSTLSSAGDVTPAEIRDTVTFSRVYSSVGEEFRILGRGVDDTVAERRYDVGQRALRVYSAAERINRPDERELLVPHLAAMKRALNRGRANAARRSAAAKAAADRTAATPDTSPATTAPVTTAPVTTAPGAAPAATDPKATS